MATSSHQINDLPVEMLLEYHCVLEIPVNYCIAGITELAPQPMPQKEWQASVTSDLRFHSVHKL